MVSRAVLQLESMWSYCSPSLLLQCNQHRSVGRLFTRPPLIRSSIAPHAPSGRFFGFRVFFLVVISRPNALTNGRWTTPKPNKRVLRVSYCFVQEMKRFPKPKRVTGPLLYEMNAVRNLRCLAERTVTKT